MNRGEQRERTHRETSSASLRMGEGNAPIDVVEELEPQLTYTDSRNKTQDKDAS